jgi:hypothetical protein
MPRILIQVLIYSYVFFYFTSFTSFAGETHRSAFDRQTLSPGKLILLELEPERKSGRGYKLVYWVDAPLDVFWRFKTDFDNDYLENNNYINRHQLVSRHENFVVTENEYANRPGVMFKWKTTVVSDRYRLNFLLLNPEDCGKKYHYGHIQLEADGEKTKVTQIAYFDFFGVSIWVNYPFYGGMKDFLKSIVRWEQKAILQLKDKYTE